MPYNEQFEGDDDEQSDKDQNVDEVINNIEVKRSHIKWYTELVNSIEADAAKVNVTPANLTSNMTQNNYKCVNLNAFIGELLERLPMWGCVMNKFFKPTGVMAQSCDVESRFSLLKGNVFNKFKLPVSITVFMERWVNEVKAFGTLSKIMISQQDCQKQVLIEYLKINS